MTITHDFDNDFHNDFNDWVTDLENAEQPTACNIHDEQCDSCGS